MTLARDAKEMAGKKFGRWLVAGPYERRVQPNGKGQLYWLCKCDCGSDRYVSGSHLRRGLSKSCGCLSADTTREMSVTHGKSKSGIYAVWCAMIARCHNPKNQAYQRYGARGIAVCEAWQTSFEAFHADMGDPPTSRHTLDRIDNDKGYSLGNCRWAVRTQQNRNRRDNVILSLNGQSMCISAWEERMGYPPNAIGRRIRDYGWSVERAILTPLRDVKEAGATQ